MNSAVLSGVAKIPVTSQPLGPTAKRLSWAWSAASITAASPLALPTDEGMTASTWSLVKSVPPVSVSIQRMPLPSPRSSYQRPSQLEK